MNVSDALLVCDGTGKPEEPKRVARFGCASRDQALVYLLRRDTKRRGDVLDRQAEPLMLTVEVPGLAMGSYKVTAWDTVAGQALGSSVQALAEGSPVICPPVQADIALAIRKLQ